MIYQLKEEKKSTMDKSKSRSYDYFSIAGTLFPMDSKISSFFFHTEREAPNYDLIIPRTA